MELKILQIKLAYVKIWGFIKAHWLEILFALMGLYAVFFAKKKQELVEQLIEEQQKKREEYKANIEELTKQIENDISKRRKVESDYQDLIKQINERHDNQIKDIAKVKQKEIKELIEKHQNDPTKMAITINEIFGIPVLGVTS